MTVKIEWFCRSWKNFDKSCSDAFKEPRKFGVEIDLPGLESFFISRLRDFVRFQLILLSRNSLYCTIACINSSQEIIEWSTVERDALCRKSNTRGTFILKFMRLTKLSFVDKVSFYDTARPRHGWLGKLADTVVIIFNNTARQCSLVHKFGERLKPA